MCAVLGVPKPESVHTHVKPVHFCVPVYVGIFWRVERTRAKYWTVCMTVCDCMYLSKC